MKSKNTTKKMAKKSRTRGIPTAPKLRSSGRVKSRTSSKKAAKCDAGVDKRFVRRNSKADAILEEANQHLLRAWEAIYESRNVRRKAST
jgi:hypothetical protein